MSEAYDKKLRRLGLDVADQIGIQIREGTYVMQSGPCYESVTECRLLSLLGADVTGTSPQYSVLSLTHCFPFKGTQWYQWKRTICIIHCFLNISSLLG